MFKNVQPVLTSTLLQLPPPRARMQYLIACDPRYLGLVKKALASHRSLVLNRNLFELEDDGFEYRRRSSREV